MSHNEQQAQGSIEDNQRGAGGKWRKKERGGEGERGGRGGGGRGKEEEKKRGGLQTRRLPFVGLASPAGQASRSDRWCEGGAPRRGRFAVLIIRGLRSFLGHGAYYHTWTIFK